jgi:hypothetical protein
LQKPPLEPMVPLEPPLAPPPLEPLLLELPLLEPLPVEPLAPEPAGPVGPVGPVGPAGPGGPAGPVTLCDPASSETSDDGWQAARESIARVSAAILYQVSNISRP